MAEKKLTRITQYGKNITKPDLVGRLLGVVDDNLFSIIKRDTEAVRKVLSEETVAITDVVSVLETADLDTTGLRIALAVKRVGKDPCIKSRLYITPRIKSITAYTAGKSLSATSEASPLDWFRVETLEEV